MARYSLSLMASRDDAMLRLIILFCLISSAAKAQLTEASHQAEFRLRPIITNLHSPWSLGFLPGGRMIISEWAGPVRIIDDGKISASLTGLPPALENAGRLEVSVHPKFSDNQLIYLCYFHGDLTSNVTRNSRGRLVGSRLENVELIFEGNDRAESYHHNGCRISWESDDVFLASFGDRRHLMEESQNLGTTTGTIVRLHADGSIPNDNPYVGHESARPEIWAYGIRNAQGLATHPLTGNFWFTEHGPLGGDEINILNRDANYGWPIATYGIDYDGSIITEDEELPNVKGPLMYWRPSTAPSGMAFYMGPHFPDWQGDLFVGSLVDRRLIRLELRGDRVLFQEHLLAELDERIRDVRMGLDGYLYILTDADPGGLYRLEPLN